MAAVTVENPPSSATESKSARKKKAKADAGTNGTADAAVAIPTSAPKESSTIADTENAAEHPYIRDLQKNIRNVNKKLGGLQKIDAIIAENKGVSLDDLVKQRKINADQKASIEKKPQLLANLAQFEEQVEQYRKFDNDHQLKLKQQKEELSLEFETKLADARSEIQAEVADKEARELQKKLLIFSQFLRAAAHKRTMEEEADTDLSMAFEGVLLLAYGGDQRAVDTAVSLINGSSESAPDVDGNRLPINYLQIRQASIDYAPFHAEEAWIEQTAEATMQNTAAGVDPTIANAGLTELQMGENVDAMAGLAVTADETSGNVAGETWDTAAAGAAGEGAKGGIDDSYEIIPRPADEVDVPVSSVQPPQSTRWDEEPPTYETVTGNKASEQWDVKAPGELVDDGSWASTSVQTGNNITNAAGDGAVPLAEDGFHEVAGRQRGRGGVAGGRGRGRGGDGEFRGRGGRRGHFRGGRGGGSDGEFRGRGGFRGGRGVQGDPSSGGRGRGRGGPRGGAPSMTPDS